MMQDYFYKNDINHPYFADRARMTLKYLIKWDEERKK